VPADKLDAAVNQDLVNLYDGLKMTESILLQTFAKLGLEPTGGSAAPECRIRRQWGSNTGQTLVKH